MNTKKQSKESKVNVVFNAILSKNQMARNGNVTMECLTDIEEALVIAMELLDHKDNQPSVKDCWAQHLV